jgi:uncharacterized protein
MTQTASPITEDDIADYLLATPDFFNRHAELLANVQLTHPHSGRAISLADRQMELQRERFKALELKHGNLLRLGKENVLLANKLHQWMVGLLAHAGSDDKQEATEQLCTSLQAIFDVPQATVAGSEAAREVASQMLLPTCGLAAEAFFSELKHYRGVARCCQRALASGDSVAQCGIAGFGVQRPESLYC